MSTTAPAGSVNRHIGRNTATWVSDNMRGSGFRLVISQIEAVSDMAMPVRPSIVPPQMSVNGRLSNTAHAERGHAAPSTIAFAVSTAGPLKHSRRHKGAKRAFQGAGL